MIGKWIKNLSYVYIISMLKFPSNTHIYSRQPTSYIRGIIDKKTNKLIVYLYIYICISQLNNMEANLIQLIWIFELTNNIRLIFKKTN